MRKRIASILLAVTLCLSFLPAQVFALEEGTCPNHPAHGDACGYAEGAPEVPCNLGCVQTGGDGQIIHTAGCAYTPAVEEKPCTHTCELCAAPDNGLQGNGAQELGAEPQSLSYSYNEGTGTLTITGNGVIGKEIKEQQGYNTWKSGVKTVEISGDITGIADQENFYGLFQSWANLEAVTYTGDTNFRVGDYAFSDCYKLKTFPFEYVSSVGEGAFKFTSFTEIALPNLSGDIDDYAFYSNKQLTSVTVTSGAEDTYIGTRAFAASSDETQLETVKISGRGILRIGNNEINGGRTFADQKHLETVDLSGFSGAVSLGNMVFWFNSSLRKVILGENTTISHVGYACFDSCTALEKDFLDFSKLTGSIDRAAFCIDTTDNTGALKDLVELDLSNVTEIGAFAMTAERKYEGYGYKDLTSVQLDSLKRLHAYAFQGASNINWDNSNIPEDAKLAYSDVLTGSDTIWQRILNIMKGKFSLDSDGYTTPLAPSDSNWEDSKTGKENSVANDSTQLTKAAKWTDADKTRAEVEIQFSYTPKEQMDFVFVLDASTSMANWYDLNSQDGDLEIPVTQETEAQYAKMYEMQSKVADVTKKLLSSEQLDSRVAVVAFSNTYNFLSDGSAKLADMLGDSYSFSGDPDKQLGFYTADDLDGAVEDIRNIPCKGSTYYYLGLWYTSYYVWASANAGRDVTVVFLSDGEAMDGSKSQYESYLEYYSNYIKNPDPDEGFGKPIFGVLYKESPTEKDQKYINMACSEDKVYLASDTDGFSAAVNRAVYTALNSFTLTDQIGKDFAAPEIGDISVSGGSVALSEDGRTITWNLEEPVPYQTYTMTIQLDLQQKDGEYPTGSFATNEGDALLKERDNEEPINQVESPVLSRTNAPDPGPGPDPDPTPDPDPNPNPNPNPDPDPNPNPNPDPGSGTNPDTDPDTGSGSVPDPAPTPDSVDVNQPNTNDPMQTRFWAVLCLLSLGGMGLLLLTAPGIGKCR